MFMDTKKVFAVIVTFNPDLVSLAKVVGLLQNQVYKIILVNNSDHCINLEGSYEKIELGRNLGIARAQSIGMEKAFADGADFVLQMDQDSVPCSDLVSNLVDSFLRLCAKGYKVGLIGPQYFDKETGEVERPRLNRVKKKIEGCYFVNDTISSGSLVSKEAYSIVGGMEDGLFIDCVDFEYCWRLRKMGFLICKNDCVYLAHRVGNGKRRIIFGITLRICQPIRHYFKFRNTILLMRRTYAPFSWRLSSLITIPFEFVLAPLFLGDFFLRLYYISKGIFDGIICRDGDLNIW